MIQWDEWRGQDENPVMYIKHLFSFRGYKLDLHKMVRADALGCYHTHPAKAFRLILWGGYAEEKFGWSRWKWCSPGSFGIVKPELCHRIALLLEDVSYSLWFSWPETHKVQLVGSGWPAGAVAYGEEK